MIRAPLLPLEAVLPLLSYAWESATNWQESEILSRALRRDLEVMHRWIQQVLTVSPFAEGIKEALLLASPDLASALSTLSSGDLDQKRVQRVLISTVRYLWRMALRPTPFGLFAGVALGQLAEQTVIYLESVQHHVKRTRMDMQWILSLIRLLEQDDDLADQLTWYPNPLLVFSGTRILLPYAHVYDAHAQHPMETLSLRATPLIQHILDLARSPHSRQELKCLAAQESPHLSQEIDQLVNTLCANDILLSILRPPLTTTSPQTYLLAQLAQVQGTQEIRTDIQHLLAQCAAYDQCAPGQGYPVLASLLQAQPARLPIPTTIEVDCRLACTTSTLSFYVAEEIARAAELLCRLSPTPADSPALQAYQTRFLERYGPAQEVPLLELLDDFCGLGAPPTYQFPPPTTPVPLPAKKALPEREQVLARLVTSALKDHLFEVHLDEDLLQELQGDPDWQQQLPHSLDLFVLLAAPSQDALNAGEYLLSIGPRCGATPAGRTFGRFCDLLGDEVVSWLAALAQEEEAQAPDILFAELVYLPARSHSANVVLRPAFRSYEIPVATAASVPAEQVIGLETILVGVDRGHFYLRSHISGKEIIVRNTHLLNLSHQVPNVVRFLAEVAGEQARQLHHFSWGNVAHLPFLPRLRAGRIVLSPARWQFPLSDLQRAPEVLSDPVHWYHYLQRWRRQWQVPRYVWLAEENHDQHLLLDLDNPLSALDLRGLCQRQLPHQESFLMREVFPAFDQAWVTGEQGHYVLECVVPLKRATPAPVRPSRFATSVPPVSQAERLRLPGSDWVYVKLYCREETQHELVLGPLRLFLEHVLPHYRITRWFFVRYHDPLPHLRLRFQAEPTSLLYEFFPVLISWLQELTQQGWIARFIVDGYEREIERYGGKQGMEVAEELFTVDSAFVLDLMALPQKVCDPLSLAILSLDFLLRTMELNQRQRLALYQQTQFQQQEMVPDHLDHIQRAYHRDQKRICQLLGNRTWLRQQEGGADLEHCLQHYVPLFQAVKVHLHAVPPAQLPMFWGSHLHMHCNRLLGDRLLESEAMYSLARTFAGFTHYIPAGIVLEGI